mmetsp:Transcript_7841/g.18555  ORF Transcript_7841/g.18555 Transcript_7841/m.18555 type:complete len:284 (-) Transcript_7841:127-978(-)
MLLVLFAAFLLATSSQPLQSRESLEEDSDGNKHLARPELSRSLLDHLPPARGGDLDQIEHPPERVEDRILLLVVLIVLQRQRRRCLRGGLGVDLAPRLGNAGRRREQRPEGGKYRQQDDLSRRPGRTSEGGQRFQPRQFDHGRRRRGAERAERAGEGKHRGGPRPLVGVRVAHGRAARLERDGVGGAGQHALGLGQEEGGLRRRQCRDDDALGGQDAWYQRPQDRCRQNAEAEGPPPIADICRLLVDELRRAQPRPSDDAGFGEATVADADGAGAELPHLLQG